MADNSDGVQATGTLVAIKKNQEAPDICRRSQKILRTIRQPRTATPSQREEVTPASCRIELPSEGVNPVGESHLVYFARRAREAVAPR